jgi:hypothetical protein
MRRSIAFGAVGGFLVTQAISDHPARVVHDCVMAATRPIRIHVGSGNVRMDGFLNVDIRRTDAVDHIGHAGNLRVFADASVATLFSHAVLEHVYAAQHLAVLREWRRVVAADGVVICLGLPDFSAAARLYLDGGPGCLNDRFDLFEVYRQTHGQPEHATVPAWRHFDPAASLNCAPSGWLPQLHKALFDPDYIIRLLHEVGFAAALFSYPYPSERPFVNLGFVARPCQVGRTDPLALDEAMTVLKELPRVERYVELATIRAACQIGAGESMVRWVKDLDTQPSLSQSLLRRALRRCIRCLDFAGRRPSEG